MIWKESNTQVVIMAHTSGDSFWRDCVEVHRENIVNSILFAAAAAVVNKDLLIFSLLPGPGLVLVIYCLPGPALVLVIYIRTDS